MLTWPPVELAWATPAAVAPAAGVGAAAVGAVTVGLAAAARAGANVGAGADGAAGPQAAAIVPSAANRALATSIRRNARRLCPRARGSISGFSRCDRVFIVLVLLLTAVPYYASGNRGPNTMECACWFQTSRQISRNAVTNSRPGSASGQTIQSDCSGSEETANRCSTPPTHTSMSVGK